MIHFFVPGEPQGKGRPKFARRGGHVTTYTPEKTENYEALIKLCCTEAMRGGEKVGGIHMLEGPLEITICAQYQIPKSASKKKVGQMLNREILPTKKPDFDNVAKVVCDALNGIAYKDDAQIVRAAFHKFYSDTPGVTVLLENLPQKEENP